MLSTVVIILKTFYLRLRTSNMQKLFSIILLSLFSILSFAQSVRQEIDSVEIFIGSQAHLKVAVQAKKGQKVVMPVFKQYEEITPGVEVLDNGVEKTAELDNNSVETSREYTLTSFEDTLYYIPAIKVQVDGKEYKGKNLALKVLTCEVDTAHPENFFPPHDVQAPPFDFNEWRQVFILAILGLLSFLLAFYFYKRLKENKPLKLKFNFRKKLTPYEQALKDINTLKTSGSVHSDNQKEYYSALTDSLRNYIESRFGFNAKEMISTEIIEALQKQNEAKMINELKQLFETADLVKFAKYEVELSENDLNLTNAIQFVTTTKPEEKKEEDIKPKKSEAEKQLILWRRIYKVLITAFILIGSALVVYCGWQLLYLL